MAFKQAAQVDSTEFREKLADVRETVVQERKKRLAGTSTQQMLSTFHSGQEKAKSKKSVDSGAGFGRKKW